MKTENLIKEVCDLISQKLEYLQNCEFVDGIEERRLTRKDSERQKLLDFVQQILSRSADIRGEAFVDEDGEYATKYPIVSDIFIDVVFDKVCGVRGVSTSEKFAEVIRRKKWYLYTKTPMNRGNASAYKKKFEAGLLSEDIQTKILKDLGFECFEKCWK